MTQPVANAAPVPTSIPPKNATTVCSGGFGRRRVSPDRRPDTQDPITRLVTSKISHQTTFFPAGGLGGLALGAEEFGDEPLEVAGGRRAALEHEVEAGDGVAGGHEDVGGEDGLRGDVLVVAPGAGDHAELARLEDAAAEAAGVDIEETAGDWRALGEARLGRGLGRHFAADVGRAHERRQEVSQVKVKVSFYDEEDRFLFAETTLVDPIVLAPGQIGRYHLMVNYNPKIDTYKTEFVGRP